MKILSEYKSVDVTEGDVNISPQRGAWHAECVSDVARGELRRDEAVFVRQSLSTPCLTALERAEGSYIFDVDGRRYLDFHGNSTHHIGYQHPRVVEAVIEQLKTMAFCPRRFTNDRAISLAERLCSLAPGGMSKVLFAPGGALAMGIAVKLAKLATGRYKTLSLWGAFHGASLDASSFGGEALFREGFGPLMPGCDHVHPPNMYRCEHSGRGACKGSCNAGESESGCVEEMEARIESGEYAAVIAEPIRCTTVLIPPRGYWERVRRACDRTGTALIFDEIPTGLGRTGELFASTTVGVNPDMIVLGKALGGSVMPLAAVLARGKYDCAPHKAVGHYTHEKSPLACAAALATLDVICGEGLALRAKQLGETARERLMQMAAKIEVIGDVRVAGLLIGVELVKTKAGREPYKKLADEVLYACLREGLSFKVSSGNVITLTPPLNVKEEEFTWALDVVERHLVRLSAEV